MMKRITLFIFFTTLISCNNNHPKAKFNKALWMQKEDWDHPQRDLILDDLTKNHKIVGLNYKQLVDSLGEPANWGEQIDSIGYEIITDFGSDIDPVYTKSLVIKLNRDSVATSFKIVEWKKD